MKIGTVIYQTSSYSNGQELTQNFLSKLQEVIDNGGQIINIVKDQDRYKKAYVTIPEHCDIDITTKSTRV